jgi:hypothetical protein
MSSFIVGIDFGTANTKATVREPGPFAPEPVVLNEQATGRAKYLLLSQGSDWVGPPPKVTLLEDAKLPANREAGAIVEAIRVTTCALRAAVTHVQRTRGGDHEFILQMGYPSAYEVGYEVVRERYELTATESCRAVQGKGGMVVRVGEFTLDERTAALVYLDTVNFEFENEPIFIVDAGGYTTHTSIIRWRSAFGGYDTGMLPLGGQTVRHGVVRVVDTVQSLLHAIVGNRATTGTAVRVIDAVMSGFLSSAQPLVRGNNELIREAVQRTVWTNLGVRPEDRSDCCDAVLTAFDVFCADPVLRRAWKDTWGPAYVHDHGAQYWSTYRLLMMGGACRVGRYTGSATTDPIAQRLAAYQAATKVASFSGVIYPEVDSRFWPNPDAPTELREAIPYLFVACGYSIPHVDWPERLMPAPIPRHVAREPYPGVIPDDG